MQSLYSAAIIWVIIGLISAFVAKRKGKNPLLWFAIGTFFSLLGLILLLLLPKNKDDDDKSTLAPVHSMNSEGGAPAEEESYSEPTPTAKRIKSDPSFQWYYVFESDSSAEVRGPMTIDLLRKAVVSLKLPLATYIWCDDFPDWTQISEFQNPSFLTDKDLIIESGDETKYDSTNSSGQLPPKPQRKSDNEEPHTEHQD